MSMHVTTTEAFAFDFGQPVTHRDEDLPSIVLDGVRATNGLEFFAIEVADGRCLWILGEVLRAA